MADPLDVTIKPLSDDAFALSCGNEPCDRKAEVSVSVGEQYVDAFCKVCANAVFRGVNRGIAASQEDLRERMGL